MNSRILRWMWVVSLSGSLWACGDDTTSGVSQVEVEDDVDDGMEDDVDAEDEPAPEPASPDVMEIPSVPASVETLLTRPEVQAGDLVEVTCRVSDESGAEVVIDAELRRFVIVSPVNSVQPVEGEDNQFIAGRAGEVTFACSVPELGLLDETPETLSVLPGAPAQVLTSLDRNVMIAGQRAQVTCEVFDAFGNALEGLSPEIATDPRGDGVNVDEEGGLEITAADLYTVTCQLDGAADVTADTLDVLPGDVAALSLGKVPEQPLYGLGQVVTFEPLATDVFGNLVEDVVLEVSSDPAAESFGLRRLRFGQEGLFTVTGRVTSATVDDAEISAEVQVLVNGTGPDIECVSPAQGAQVEVAPGSDVTIQVRVADANDVGAVFINNQEVAPNEDGLATVVLPAEFGINFAEIVATDGFGERNTAVCTFMAANNWLRNDRFLDDAVTLRMAQAAVDDGNRGGQLNSLGDALNSALNSDGLVSQIDGALRGANPLLNSCVSGEVCLPFVGCSCPLRVRVDYRSLSIRGANDVSLRLVDNGLRAVANVRNIQVNLRVDTNTLGDTNGSVTLSSMSADLTFDLSLRNNQPRVTLRGNPGVGVGRVSTNFSGLNGTIINVIVDLFEGSVRNLIRDQLASFIEDSFDEILDSVISGLDINNIGSSFDVPRVDGGGSVPVGFGVRFSSITTNTARSLFGIGMRFTTPNTQRRAPLGVPLPPGAVRLDPSTNRALAVGAHVGVINLFIYTMWRAGYFDLSVPGSLLGAGDSVNIEVSADMPMVAELVDDNNAQITFGGLNLQIDFPEFFSEPLELTVGGRASASVSLRDGDELVFGDITIDELLISTGDLNLDPTSQAIIEDFVLRLLQRLLGGLLNDALPPLPIPSFELPRSLSEFGIPSGRLGVRNPALNFNNTHIVIQSDFGLQ